MGMPVLVLGESGSGKSCSLRNFSADEVSVFNVAGKRLPFRAKLPCRNTSDYNIIEQSMKGSQKKTFVIDDSQYLMCFDAFARCKEVGYGKFTDMAMGFYNLLQFIIRELPPDVIVYLLHHTETDQTTGKLKAKTLGKMLDNQLTVEGLFTVVNMCVTDSTGHYFITNNDGTNPAKSPMEMLPERMDNDLKAVDTAIREYYGINIKEEQNG